MGNPLLDFHFLKGGGYVNVGMEIFRISIIVHADFYCLIYC